jgi:alkaline phosphatase
MNTMKRLALAAALAAASLQAFAAPAQVRNIIFFLGDGMGPTAITAARIHLHKEEGALFFESFERTARIKTYANDAQTTDSAPSMGSYMTGYKINNEVISMSGDTVPKSPGKDTNGTAGAIDNCGEHNGKPVPTILEIAKAHGKSIGAITTTELTHATPAASLTHSCHRLAQFAIATQIAPGGAGYNAALLDGADVLMGGGRNHFTPYDAQANPAGRIDGRDLVAQMQDAGYGVAFDRAGMFKAHPGKKFLGLYAKKGHLEYEFDRTATPPRGEGATQPSLAEMTAKAIELLRGNPKGYFLMVEGGRIDHGLHDTNARRALDDVGAFDDAIRAALAKVRETDPELRHTLLVVTADHDHTMVFNGASKRGNPVLDIARGADGAPILDAGGHSYTTLAFGNGPNRPAERASLDSVTVLAPDYKQETNVRMSGETHGGGDVKLFAIGAGSAPFKGTMENTHVFDLMLRAYGLKR